VRASCSTDARRRGGRETSDWLGTGRGLRAPRNAAAGRAPRVLAVHAPCVPQRRRAPLSAQRENRTWVCVHLRDVDPRGFLAAGEVAGVALRWRRWTRCHRAREEHRNTHGAGGHGERARLSIRRSVSPCLRVTEEVGLPPSLHVGGDHGVVARVGHRAAVGRPHPGAYTRSLQSSTQEPWGHIAHGRAQLEHPRDTSSA
jgi:hypothetical protein